MVLDDESDDDGDHNKNDNDDVDYGNDFWGYDNGTLTDKDF